MIEIDSKFVPYHHKIYIFNFVESKRLQKSISKLAEREPMKLSNAIITHMVWNPVPKNDNKESGQILAQNQQKPNNLNGKIILIKICK